MARPRVKTEQEIKEDKHKRYKARYNDEDKKAQDDAKREEYAKTIKQIKLTLPNAQGDELKTYCENHGIKAQDLIRKLLVDAGVITPIEE